MNEIHSRLLNNFYILRMIFSSGVGIQHNVENNRTYIYKTNRNNVELELSVCVVIKHPSLPAPCFLEQDFKLYTTVSQRIRFLGILLIRNAEAQNTCFNRVITTEITIFK